MEASLPAITPTAVPPPKTRAQSAPASDETTSFSNFLDAATADNTPKETQESVDTETSVSTSSQQEVMAAELAALSLQEIPALPVRQLLTGQEASLTFSGMADPALPATPVIPVVTPASLAIPVTPTTPANTEVNAQQQIMTMSTNEPVTTSQAAADTALEAGKELSTEPFSVNTPKSASLLTQQIDSILNGDPRNTLAVHTSALPAPSDSLNGLTSPYLQSAIESATMSKPMASRTEVDVDGNLTQDTGKSLRDNMGKHSLDTKIEGVSDQRTSGQQQQETGQQENNASQQNTITPLSVSQSNNESASQFIVTGLGTQTAITTPGHTSAAQPATLTPAVQVPAEELINHLVERFSINPRLQTSKISLNLNPAELGALKIDILVKGDSIKAHIAAGTQQIQDTIEKNMPKLRAILEQQGFTVEDFKVTLEATDSSRNDFFQQQFSSRQDSTPRGTVVPGNASFEPSLNSVEELYVGPMDSGINLSI
ncbi:MAG: flagellar hook-length control [Desulfobulbaceae bacterium]|jgi:flagellar hook-length control protein FliK|nr:MAG: flagellar hook-length control [Desulfobulbaceae bacterium]